MLLHRVLQLRLELGVYAPGLIALHGGAGQGVGVADIACGTGCRLGGSAATAIEIDVTTGSCLNDQTRGLISKDQACGLISNDQTRSVSLSAQQCGAHQEAEVGVEVV